MSALPVARSDQVGYAFFSCPEPRLAEFATSSGPAANVPSAGASLRPSFWSIAKLELSRACTREGPSPRHRGMPSPEEYRQSAKEARKQANACRNQWERQGLQIVADHTSGLPHTRTLPPVLPVLQHRPSLVSRRRRSRGLHRSQMTASSEDRLRDLSSNDGRAEYGRALVVTVSDELGV